MIQLSFFINISIYFPLDFEFADERRLWDSLRVNSAKINRRFQQSGRKKRMEKTLDSKSIKSFSFFEQGGGVWPYVYPSISYYC